MSFRIIQSFFAALVEITNINLTIEEEATKYLTQSLARSRIKNRLQFCP